MAVQSRSASTAQAVPKGQATTTTVCHMCYNGCQTVARTVNGVVVRIEGRKDGVNEGRLCPKGNSAIMYLYDPNRLKVPLKRTNPEKGFGVDPKWQEITWEEALDLIALRLARIRQQDPRNLVVGCMDVTRFGHSAAFGYAFGTRAVGLVGSAGGPSCGNGMHMLGPMIHGSFIEAVDYEYCNYLMQWGAGTAFESYPALNPDARRCADARVRGMKLVVVDPRLSAAAAKADEWVPIRPGTDGALALGMLHVLLHELGVYDAEFLKHHTNAPYLISPDGYYVRARDSGKPLVWDGGAGQARPYDEAVQDYVLEGEYTANGVACKPAFQLLKERVKSYPPEEAARITTVPAETVRRLAREWGEAARIGAKVKVGGRELPWRPAGLMYYRGTQGHKQATTQTLALEMLAMVVGALDVPGSMCPRTGAARSGFRFPIAAGKDGLISHASPYEVELPVTYPATEPDLRSWFPPAGLGHTLLPYTTAANRERFGLKGESAILLFFTNPLMTAGDRKVIANGLKKSFVVVADVVMSETAEFADVVLPEASFLERYCPTGFGHPNYLSQMVFQPVAEPQYGQLDIMEVFIQLADRLGILKGTGGLNFWLNTVMNFQPPYLLDLNRKYTWEEVVDQFLRSYTKGEHDLSYFRENFLLQDIGQQKYWPFGNLRLPFYVEELKEWGDRIQREFQEHRIEGRTRVKWDFTDYDPLPSWRPGPIQQAPPEYDMYAIAYKGILGAHGRGANNPWIMEQMEKDPFALKLWLNRATAHKKGIRDGDAVWVESPVGKVKGTASLAESIHPECVGFGGGALGHWANHSISRGRGSHFNSLCSLGLESIDLVSGAVQNAATRVKIYKAPTEDVRETPSNG